LFLGNGIVSAEAVQLVVALARLCRKVQDGKNNSIIGYLNLRLHIAAIHYPVVGRDLPKMLASKVAAD